MHRDTSVPTPSGAIWFLPAPVTLETLLFTLRLGGGTGVSSTVACCSIQSYPASQIYQLTSFHPVVREAGVFSWILILEAYSPIIPQGARPPPIEYFC